MSNAGRPPHARPAGASRVAGAPTGRKWLLPLLLGLLVLLALVFLVSRCAGDDPDEPAGTTTPTAVTSAPSSTGTASAPTSATAGQTTAGQSGLQGAVIAGGGKLTGAGGATSLKEHAGQQAVGRGVPVQSVPADEGFWVGEDEQDRLWVQLTGTRGESDYKVKQGDTVDFTGTVTPAAKDFAATVGVTAAEGADQLTTQGHYVAVPSSSVTLSQ